MSLVSCVFGISLFCAYFVLNRIIFICLSPFSFYLSNLTISVLIHESKRNNTRAGRRIECAYIYKTMQNEFYSLGSEIRIINFELGVLLNYSLS